MSNKVVGIFGNLSSNNKSKLALVWETNLVKRSAPDDLKPKMAKKEIIKADTFSANDKSKTALPQQIIMPTRKIL